MPFKKKKNQYKEIKDSLNHCIDKPYNLWGDYLNHKYNTRVLKLPIDAGLSCPNRDGTISDKGCVFCSPEGSASSTATKTSEISKQMNLAKKSFKRADEDTRYIAYFQAFTNTYAPVKKLKSLYDQAISKEDVIGLMIATRPDCIKNGILDLIASYKKENFELWLEIGMQTMHDKSHKFLNRGHVHGDTKKAILQAAESKIPVCVHIILGIPGESWRDMMDTAEEISALPVSGVKFHHLHVIKGTELERLYNENKIDIIEFKDYVSTITDFLERLRPDIMIHRLIGDRDEKTLISPEWGMYKGTVIKAIDDEFERRCTYQGFLL